jgi:phytoene desaturase
MNKSVLVIGSGVGGLATAIRLRIKGYEVSILEKNNYAGGKLAQIRSGDYRFDTGPSLFTLPTLVDDLFRLCGKKPEDYFSYQKLPLICRYFFPDGMSIDAFADIKEFAQEVEQKTKVPAKKLLSYLDKSRIIYNITANLFIFRAFRKLSTLFSFSMLKAILNAYKLNAFQTVHQANKKWFNEEHLEQLFNRYATYNGSNPYQAPATLNLIQHLEHNIGAYFPDKGMYSIIESLTKLARDIGVKIEFEVEVEEIVAKNKKIVGVRANKEFRPADVVVSNADVVPTYKMLNLKVPKSITRFDRSTSALIFYWGVKKQFKELELHNILFASNYKAEFNDLFKNKTIHYDPTVYIFISSKQVSEDAPVGCENWFVMVNTPENIGQDWDTLVKQARQNIVDKINKKLNTNIEQLIENEHVFDPRDIESRTSAFRGSLYGSSSNSKWAAFLRHKNVSSKFKNLYFCGGTVHPGGGIPLCLSSAKIVTEEL